MADNSVLSEAIIFARSVVENEAYDVSKQKMDNLLATGENAAISSMSLAIILAKHLALQTGLSATELLDKIQYEIIVSHYEQDVEPAENFFEKKP